MVQFIERQKMNICYIILNNGDLVRCRAYGVRYIRFQYSTLKSVLNGLFIKRNFVLNGNIFRSRDYHSIP
jgi:hypothetical protein